MTDRPFRVLIIADDATESIDGIVRALEASDAVVALERHTSTPHATRLAAARERMRDDHLNLAVVCDPNARAPLVLITPEGGAIPMSGARDDVARDLTAFVQRRLRVRWGRSEPIPDTATIERAGEVRRAIRRRAGTLLGLAQRANLLPGTDGNVSYRAAALGFWVTPRQVPKTTLTADDLIFVEAALPDRIIRYRGDRKPSIDSLVQAILYAHLPNCKGLLHFHDGVVIADAETEFPYPCGTVEEAEEILQAIDRAVRSGRYRGGPFAVRLAHHGHLIGIEPGGADRLEVEWRIAEHEYRAHLRAVTKNGSREALVLQPIFASATIVGVLARLPERGATSAFILERYRSRGYGEEVVAQLDARGDTIVAHDDCRVVEYYALRGYRPTRRDGAVVYLEPPSRRRDIRTAASVCCWHPVSGTVLIGRRRTPPFDGFHAFPGGTVVDGESPIEAALRELREETGIVLTDVSPVRESTYTVGTADGSTVWRVTNIIVPLEERLAPSATVELEAAWVPIPEALSLRPMVTHSTGRILRAVAALQTARGPST